LVTAFLSVVTIAGGAAHGQPDITPSPLPPAIDPLLPINPEPWFNPIDEGPQTSKLRDFGRYCENYWVHCQ
jgi:hypothetical protein